MRAAVIRGEQRAREFDQTYGVDTAGYIHPTDLALNHPNQVHAVSYGASDPEDVRTTLASLVIDYRNYTFIDFGSGKGRVILLASEFPFKQVIGIEFSAELHQIAQSNIDRSSSGLRHCTEVKSINMDAVDYALPDDNLVCYFCNPFDEPIMRRVVENLHQSLARRAREIIILYYNAKLGYLFDQSRAFEKVEADSWIRMWRNAKLTNRDKPC